MSRKLTHDLCIYKTALADQDLITMVASDFRLFSLPPVTIANHFISNKVVYVERPPQFLTSSSKKVGNAGRAHPRDMCILIGHHVIQDERRRMKELQPYLVTAPKSAIIGTSRHASRLRKDIVKAARQSDRYCNLF